jgi:hypothetical protein
VRLGSANEGLDQVVLISEPVLSEAGLHVLG